MWKREEGGIIQGERWGIIERGRGKVNGEMRERNGRNNSDRANGLEVGVIVGEEVGVIVGEEVGVIVGEEVGDSWRGGVSDSWRGGGSDSWRGGGSETGIGVREEWE
jgi:hypothetical protein